MKKDTIVEIISLLFILLFTYAAFNKLIDIEKFQIQIGQSPLLTGFEWIAFVVPPVEVALAIMLVIPKLRLIALYGAFNLMIMFTAYIVAILNFSFYIPCSCGGVLDKLGWKEHLIFNTAFVFLALVGILVQSNKSSKNDSAKTVTKGTASVPL